MLIKIFLKIRDTLVKGIDKGTLLGTMREGCPGNKKHKGRSTALPWRSRKRVSGVILFLEFSDE